MSKPLTAGREVEAYCTKCRLDLDHRIVAMEGERIARVECLTCRTQHNYYKPKSAEPAAKTRAPRQARESGPSSSRARSASSPRKLWEQAIAGKTPADFTPYNINATFGEGQLVSHKKFGDGVVTEVLQGDKVQVVFADGPKILIHARP